MASLDEPAAVRRLLDRFGFGAGQADLTAGFTPTAAGLLNPSNAPATPEPDLGAEITRPGKAGGTAAKKQAAQAIAQQEATLALWWLDRMVATTTPLVERMTWFWHGHFATSEQKVRAPRLMQRQNDTFRQDRKSVV